MSYRRRRRKLVRWLISGALLISVFISMSGTVPAQDTSPAVAETLSVRDSPGHPALREYEMFLFMSLGIGFADYDFNMEVPEDGSFKRLGKGGGWNPRGELGIRFRSVGVLYYGEWIRSSVETALDDTGGYYNEASLIRHGLRGFYEMSYKRFRLAPEGGYVFLTEYFNVYYPGGGKPGLYEDRYHARDWNYGFSAGCRLYSVKDAGLWLYGRYVHDCFKIKTDNYWLGLEYGAETSESITPDPGWPFSFLRSVHAVLVVKWTRKAVGRSDLSIILNGGVTYGLF